MGNRIKSCGFLKFRMTVSKADMLDDELKDEIRNHMKGMEVMFFSSVTEQGVGELIDLLWATVSAEV